MIKLKPLYEIKVIPHRVIFITEKGVEAMNKFWELNKSIEYFNLYEDKKLWQNDFQDWVARGAGGSSLMEAAFNLTIIADDQLISVQPKQFEKFKEDWRKYRGEEFNESGWFNQIIREELVKIQ